MTEPAFNWKTATETDAMFMFMAELRKSADPSLRTTQYLRARGLTGQIRVVEKAMSLARRLVKRGRIDADDYLLLRDTVWTLRMLMRVCNDREFTTNDDLIEYLAAELAREHFAGKD